MGIDDDAFTIIDRQGDDFVERVSADVSARRSVRHGPVSSVYFDDGVCGNAAGSGRGASAARPSRAEVVVKVPLPTSMATRVGGP
jgi:hypothetical protein